MREGLRAAPVRAVAPLVTWILLTAIPASAQAPARTRVPSGLRLWMGISAVQPYMVDYEGSAFAPLGRFRVGLGSSTGVGYDTERLGVSVGMDLAGPELGPEREVGGIGMGREASALQAYTLLAHWRPALRSRGWRWIFSGGYVWTDLGGVSLRGDQLPNFVRDSAGAPADTVRGEVGVRGPGLRFAASAERSFGTNLGLSGDLSLRIGTSADVVSYRALRYHGRRASIPGGARGVTPRVEVSLQWRPNADVAKDFLDVPPTPVPEPRVESRVDR